MLQPNDIWSSPKKQAACARRFAKEARQQVKDLTKQAKYETKIAGLQAKYGVKPNEQTQNRNAAGNT